VRIGDLETVESRTQALMEEKNRYFSFERRGHGQTRQVAATRPEGKRKGGKV